MSFEVKKLDGNMAELTITVPAADFDKALVAAYNKNKKKFSMPGFRKGKVPMTLIEKEYGAGVFYDDAANDLINETYPAELKAHEDLEVVSNPEIKVSQIEKGKDFIYVATVATKPAVELGDLEAIEVKVMDTTVTDEDVEAEIKRNLKQNSSKVDVTDRAAELEDETTIDFVGSVDGVEFEGGKGNDYPLVLGSGSFIPGFEDQIVGHSVGETFDVNVTFPEEYQAEDLAGKAAVFKTTIKAIKAINMPELDDAYVSDTTDFETVDEYKADVKKKLEEKKAADAKNDKENKAVDKLVEMSKMDIPEAMLRFQQEQMVRDFEQRLMYQGMNMDQYLQMTKQTREDMMEQVKPNAEKQIKSSLVVQPGYKKNNIEFTDEVVDKNIEKMAKQYNMEVEKIKELVKEQLDNVRTDIKMQKAVELIASKAKEVK